MIEISLFYIITLITFLDAYKNHIVSLILKFIPQSSEIKSASTTISSLEKELSTISMINEFAKHVKLQRKITKLKDSRKELVKQRTFKIMKIKFAIMTAFYVLIFGSLIYIVWWNRKESVAQVPAHWLWPLTSFFDWSNIPGSISVPCWIAISSRATKAIVRHF